MVYYQLALAASIAICVVATPIRIPVAFLLNPSPQDPQHTPIHPLSHQSLQTHEFPQLQPSSPCQSSLHDEYDPCPTQEVFSVLCTDGTIQSLQGIDPDGNHDWDSSSPQPYTDDGSFANKCTTQSAADSPDEDDDPFTLPPPNAEGRQPQSGPFRVPKCRSNLRKNVLQHGNEKPFPCPVCDTCLSSPKNLRNHKSKVHGRRSEVVHCGICSKPVRRYNLRKHETIHQDESPYKCSYCPMVCARPESLRIHEAAHTGDKPFVCECGKSFAVKARLNKHKEGKRACSLSNLTASKADGSS